MPRSRLTRALRPDAVAAAGLLLAAACSHVWVPSGVLSEESAERAVATLEGASDQVRRVEGGLLLPEAYFEETRPALDPGPIDAFETYFLYDLLPPEPRTITVLVGPRRIYVPYRNVRRVSARIGTFWTAVEITLEGPLGDAPTNEPGTLFLLVEDAVQARSLAEAIDLLVRAMRGPKTGFDALPGRDDARGSSHEEHPAAPPRPVE